MSAVEIQNTVTLRSAFDEVCKVANVDQSDGPSIAYFRDARDKPYAYEAFDMGGAYEEFWPLRRAATFDDALSAGVAFFQTWLKPGRALVWRQRPEAVRLADMWGIYYRCVQLDEGVSL